MGKFSQLQNKIVFTFDDMPTTYSLKSSRSTTQKYRLSTTHSFPSAAKAALIVFRPSIAARNADGSTKSQEKKKSEAEAN